MCQSISKTVIKFVTSPLFASNYVILVFRLKVQLLINFSIFTGIKLKFGGGVNSETLNSLFMSMLPNKMNLMKGFYCHFLGILLKHYSIKVLPL